MAQLFNRWSDVYGEDPVSKTTTATVGKTVITVDHLAPAPSTPTQKSQFDTVKQPRATLPVVNGPDIKLSMQSGIAPFETLFNNLDLQCEPFYNFWEENETTNEGFAQGNRDLAEIPRYNQLWWSTAPDLKDPNEAKKNALKTQDPDARSVFTQLSPFGFGSHEIVSSAQNGIQSLPPHLQPSGFKDNAKQLANGFVFSGILEATSEIQINDELQLDATTAGILKNLQHKVDEDAYLAEQSNTGISVSQQNASLWQYESSLAGVGSALGGGGAEVAPSTALQHASLVSGQFGMAAPYLNAGQGLRSINPSSPAISLPFVSSVGGRMWDPPTYSTSATVKPAAPANQVQSAKVKLLHTSLGKMYDDAHINTIVKPHQAENMIAIVPFVDGLLAYAAAGIQQTPRDFNIPSTAIPDVVKPLEYIGYIIEKYEQVNGSYKKVDDIYIPGREYDSYNDCKVKYGTFYRYRIRAVVRWSRPKSVGVLGNDISVGESIIASASLTPNAVSYFGSEWSANWVYALLGDFQKPSPPDEIRVRPVSKALLDSDPNKSRPFGAVEIAVKMPYDPQNDINLITLWRKEMNAQGRVVSEWSAVATTSASNQLFVDADVKYWGEGGGKYVYAATCSTRHSEISPLSDQVAVRMNSHWKKEGEYPVEFVSCAGVDLENGTGPFSTYPPTRERTEVVFNTNFNQTKGNWEPGMVVMTGQNRIAPRTITNTHYIARIESLDNGQVIDVPVDISVVNMPEQFEDISSVG